MLVVSNEFKQAMKQPVKELKAYLSSDDVEITDSDNLISIKISCESGMCKTAMRKLEAKYLGETNLIGKWVRVGYGVKVDDGTFEYLNYGSFKVTEINYIKDTEITTITGYDKMINSMVEYKPLEVDYPINLYDYTSKLCEACNLTLDNETFVNADWIINKELYENIDGITYRDIFVQVAQATASTCIVSNDDNIHFKPLFDTGEVLTYDNMFTFKLGDKYGEINSVVLSRTPQEDNIYMRDEESIAENGLTEFKIENNEIIDKDRESAMTPIYNALHGINYYPFEIKTEGLGWFEIADSFDIANNEGDVFNTSLFNFSITIDGGIKESLKTVADTKTQTQYQYATTIAKRVKNTEIIVDKQEQHIESIVSDMYDEDGLINNKFTQIFQDINGIVNSVQGSGGNNLIKNSVMFAYDDDKNPVDWDISGDGTLNISTNIESLNNGALSGHAYTLLNKKAIQKITVKQDSNDIKEENKTYYTFSTRIKKLLTGSCYVKIYNDVENYIISLESGEESFWDEYSLKLLPKSNYYYIEFYGSADSGATFTDNMLAIGSYKSQWTQANGEIMNTQVNINVDGVLVKSSIYQGDYTIMSPLEFAGYSKINGIITKVFSLNKDTTLVKKLEAEDEMKMIPIKIVPIINGEIPGWHFVKSK